MSRPILLALTAATVVVFLAFLFWPQREQVPQTDSGIEEAGLEEGIDWDTYEGDVGAGATIAMELCSRCHAVTMTGESPILDAPPFRTFADRWPLEYLDEALAEGIMVGHPEHQMPVFQFTEREIADLIAYMAELGEAQ